MNFFVSKLVATFFIEVVVSPLMKVWISKLKMRFPAIGLLLITILFWSFYDRYEPVGAALLADPSLSAAFKVYGDVVEESPGCFVMTVPEGGKRAGLYFRVPEAINFSIIRVRATVSFDHVSPGEYLWNCTRVLLVQRDAKNRWIPTDHVLMGGWGTSSRTAYKDEFEIVPEAVLTDFCLQQHGSAGTAFFEKVSLQPVRIRASFLWWRIGFVCVWIGMAVYYFPRCRMHRRRLKVLIFLNALAILFGALMPGDWIEGTVKKAEKAWVEFHRKSLKEVAPSPKVESAAPGKVQPAPKPVPPKADDEPIESIREQTHIIGHFLLFASLCLLVYLSAALEHRHSNYFMKVGFDIFLFAAITEALQFLTMDRSPGFSDLLIDLCGMVFAFVLFLCVLPLLKCRQAHRLKTTDAANK